MVKEEGATGTVLVAEDEDAMRELLNDILDTGGYRVISVADGEAAVRTFAERKDEVDLVILDMSMPKLNGSETFRRLKAINKDVRVLLSSGYNRDTWAQQLLEEGLAGFIGKPYQVGELLDKVGEIIYDRKRL